MTPLSDALTAAQKRALAAMEKAYVADFIPREAATEELNKCGITDPVEIGYLFASPNVLREWGAPVPAETNGAPKQDEPASEKQKQLIQSLCERHKAPFPAAVGTKSDASKIIDELQNGTYDPAKWSVPF